MGCGDRWVETSLGFDIQYVGLDYPPTVNLGYAGSPDTFADAGCLPFSDASFDTVLLLDVLEHLPQPEAALAEARRVLKTGGKAIVQVPFLYPLHAEPHDFQRWMLHGLADLFTRHRLDVQETSWQGHPAETGAALLAIALAKNVVDSANGMPISIVLAPFPLAMIPCVNLFGWLIARLMSASAFMPLGYRMAGVKTE